MATTKSSATRKSRDTSSRSPEESREEMSFERGSGNVFADMGASDTEERLAKAELARIVRLLVQERVASGATQSQVAKALGIKAPDLSDLMRGRLTRFSRERLEMMPVRLGRTVQIIVGPASTSRASLTVELAESVA